MIGQSGLNEIFNYKIDTSSFLSIIGRNMGLKGLASLKNSQGFHLSPQNTSKLQPWNSGIISAMKNCIAAFTYRYNSTSTYLHPVDQNLWNSIDSGEWR